MSLASKTSARKLLLPGADMALAATAATAAEMMLALGLHTGARLGPLRLVASTLLVTFVLVAGLYALDLYQPRHAFEDAPRGGRLYAALATSSVSLALCAAALHPAEPALVHLLPAGFAAASLALVLGRRSLPWFDRRFGLRTRVLLVGQGAELQAFLRSLRDEGGIDVVAVMSPTAGDVLPRALASGAQYVVVALAERRGMETQELLRCRLAGIPVLDAASFAERELRRIPVGLVHPSDMIFSDGFDRSPMREALRRGVALLAALVLALLAAPVLLVVAALIKLDSPGPVLYRQVRVGHSGRSFTMLKFRTMHVDAERAGASWAGRSDPRVTRVGRYLRRFRLDELPQILNVLRGEMSLVGPRPERPEFVRQLRCRIPYYDLRKLVLPGITGWAQVRYPYAASLEESKDKLQYDLYYVKRPSVTLDLLILFATVKVVLFGRGAR